MPDPHLQSLLTQAIHLHRANNLDAAKTLYHQILATDPAQPDAHHFLGLILLHQQKPADALPHFQAALTALPGNALFHANLARALHATGQYQDAIQHFDESLRLNPGLLDALVLRALACIAAGRFQDAANSSREALERRPKFAPALVNLGTALRELGDLHAAESAFREAVAAAPDRLEPRLGLARLLSATSRAAEARDHLAVAATLAPNDAEIHTMLGAAEAAATNSANAIPHYQRALQLKPDYPEALLNLGDALRMNGNIEAGLPLTRRAVELNPHNSLLHSALLYAMLFSPDTTPDNLLAEHQKWATRHVAPLLAKATPHTVSPGPRRLRIGYLSPDFRDHPVGRYFLPIFQNHDTSQFELFAYSTTRKRDTFTDRCQAAVHHWRDVADQSDELLAHTLRTDNIDILIDLSLHMAENRQLALARKPAPVQIAFSYPGITGSPAITARISDPFLDPPGPHTLPGPEAVLRLPHPYSFWCFVPHEDDHLPVQPRPALSSGRITFGSLNNPAKSSAAALRQWQAVLDAVPNAQLLLLSNTPDDPAMRARFPRPESLRFLPKAPRSTYLSYYHQIDIVLDPWPYTGHCTSNDALWMGVPVITRTGDLPHTRAGESLLQTLGLSELVARSEAEFVALAKRLAGDLPRLNVLSETLRPRMQTSPLMDIKGYTRALEALYLSHARSILGS